MSLQALKNINRTTAPPTEKPKNFRRCWSSSRVVPPGLCRSTINPERMARIALTAFRTTPKLADCDHARSSLPSFSPAKSVLKWVSWVKRIWCHSVRNANRSLATQLS